MSDNNGGENGEERREKAPAAVVDTEMNRSGTERSLTMSESVVEVLMREEEMKEGQEEKKDGSQDGEEKGDKDEGRCSLIVGIEEMKEEEKKEEPMKEEGGKLVEPMENHEVDKKKGEKEKDEEEKGDGEEREDCENEGAMELKLLSQEEEELMAKEMEEKREEAKFWEEWKKEEKKWIAYESTREKDVAYHYKNREYAWRYGDKETDTEYWAMFWKEVSQLFFDAVDELTATRALYRHYFGTEEGFPSPDRLQEICQRAVDRNNAIEEAYYRNQRLALMDQNQRNGEGLHLRDPLPPSDESDTSYITALSDLDSLAGSEALSALTNEKKTIFQKIAVTVEKAKNTVEAAHKKLTKDAVKAQKKGAALEKQLKKSESEASLALEAVMAQLDALEETTAPKGLLGNLKDTYDSIRGTVARWRMADAIPYLPQPTVYVNVLTVIEDGDVPEEDAPPVVPNHQEAPSQPLRLPTAPPVTNHPCPPPFWVTGEAAPATTSGTTTTLPTRPLSSVLEEEETAPEGSGSEAPSSPKILNGMIKMPARYGRKAHSRSVSIVSTTETISASPSRPPLPNGDVPHEQPAPRQARPGIVRRAMAWVRRRFSRGGRQTAEDQTAENTQALATEGDYEIIPDDEKKGSLDAEKKQENEEQKKQE